MSNTMTKTMTTAGATTTRGGELRKARLGAVVAAALAALTIWAIVEGGFGTDLRAPATGNAAPADIGPLTVVTASAVASLAGWALLALLERFTARARRVWAVVALMVLVVSLGGALGGTGITTANRISLALMHIVVAAVLIPLLHRTSPSRINKPVE